MREYIIMLYVVRKYIIMASNSSQAIILKQSKDSMIIFVYLLSISTSIDLYNDSAVSYLSMYPFFIGMAENGDNNSL